MRLTMLACCVLTLAACGGEKPAPAPEPAPAPAPSAPAEPTKPEPAAPAAAPAAAGATLTPDAEGVVRLTANDQMQYNAAHIEVAASGPVKIELAHIGKMTVEQMGHNVVILKPGNDPMQFAMKGIAAKATDYVAEEVKDQVIAKTRILGGGEKAMLEVTLPGPGTYPFVCTFPGHAGVMKGELVAK